MKKNANLKGGVFKEKELGLYEGLDDRDIEVILEYQKRLPVLQEDNGSWIDGRVLHEQLVKFQKTDKDGKLIEGTEFTKWIDRRIDKYEFIEDVDFTSFVKFDEGDSKGYGNKTTKEYNISVDMAKNLCMIENNKIGRLSRKYFIAIEKAFKERYNWNIDRYQSIEMCHELKSALAKNTNELEKYLPDWHKYKNIYAWEFNILNTIIMGMTAKEYRAEKGLNKNEPIRNTFTEKQLYKVHKLEDYDAILLDINNILDTSKRSKLLEKYYKERFS